jgi:hypothetical protein
MAHFTVKAVVGKTCYQVINDKTKKVVDKCVTMARGKAQAKKLNELDHRTFLFKEKKTKATKKK